MLGHFCVLKNAPALVFFLENLGHHIFFRDLLTFKILSKDLSIQVTQKNFDTKIKHQIFVWWDQLKLTIKFQIIE